MDPVISALQNSMPRFNENVCEGLACKQLTDVDDHIHQVVVAISKTFPEGLTYHGYRRCTPYEQFQYQSHLPGRPRLFDMSPSDVYMAQFHFKFQGKDLPPKPMLLPYVNRGGVITLRGSKFVISPAMVDNLFSIEEGNIFVPLTRSRINFSPVHTSFIANEREVNVDAVYSLLYNLKKGEGATKCVPTLANYLFAYHGVTETFKRYFGVEVHIGSEKKINKDNFPSNKWVICKSNGNTYSRRYGSYSKTPMRIALPASEFKSRRELESTVGAYFYVLDHISDHGFVTEEQLDTPRLWQRALVRFIFKSIDSEQKAITQIETHLESLNYYIDELVRRKLEYEKIPVKNMKELLHYMICNFTNMTMSAEVSSTHNKYLVTTQFVLHDITCDLFRMMYSTKKLTGARLTIDAVEKVLRGFPTDKILNIASSGHGEVNSLESASDCMLWKVTMPVIPQTRATGKTGNNKASEMKDPTYQLSETITTTNSYLAISKSAPSGRGKLNPFMRLEENGAVIPDPRLAPLRKNVRALIKKGVG